MSFKDFGDGTLIGYESLGWRPSPFKFGGVR